jgi:Na+/H+ antiporter NhaD/arsenite permease-like protein
MYFEPPPVSTGPVPAGSFPAAPEPRPGWRGWRRQLRLVVTLIAVGVLVAFLWRVLTPHTAELGDEQEAAAAVDGTLALLGLVVGMLTGVLVLLRPGPAPAARTVAAIVGSLLGGLVSWLLGDQLGTPPLRAVAAAFVWPVATSAVLFVGSLMPWSSSRIGPPNG